MQHESSQSDLAERDVPTRSRARFPGGAVEGAGAERVCVSVRVSVCRRSLCLSGTHTKPSSCRLPRSGLDISGYGSIAVLLLLSPLTDVGCSSAHRGDGGGGGIPIVLPLPGEMVIILSCNVLWSSVGILWKTETGAGVVVLGARVEAQVSMLASSH